MHMYLMRNGTQRLLACLVNNCSIVLCWSLSGATETSRQMGKAKVKVRRDLVNTIHHYIILVN